MPVTVMISGYADLDHRATLDDLNGAQAALLDAVANGLADDQGAVSVIRPGQHFRAVVDRRIVAYAEYQAVRPEHVHLVPEGLRECVVVADRIRELDDLARDAEARAAEIAARSDDHARTLAGATEAVRSQREHLRRLAATLPIPADTAPVAVEHTRRTPAASGRPAASRRRTTGAARSPGRSDDPDEPAPALGRILALLSRLPWRRA